MNAIAALDGIRVLELCEVAAGPFCAMTLADMGADVIKVERPGGDVMRSWPPMSDGFSENFASLNRNKRSVVLDLKTEAGAAAARELAAESDVIVENYRPGVLARLGLGFAELHKRHPALIYCSISAFGQTGPRSTEGGFDLTMQAMAGVMSVTGQPGDAPTKCGVPLCDFTAGLYGALAIVGALNERHRTGFGRHIDVSMFGTTLAVAALQTSEYFGAGADPQRLGSAHPRNAPYQAFASSDGHFGLAAGNDRLWQLVCEVIERPDLAADPAYGSPAKRAANQEPLRLQLDGIFMSAPTAQWLERFAKAGVPCSPINTYSQALADRQVEHMGWVQPLRLPNGVETQTFGPPVRIDGETAAIQRPPPALGEHTAAVLGSLPHQEGQPI